MLKKAVSLLLTPGTSTKHITTRLKWIPACTRYSQGSWGVGAHLLQVTAALVARLRVRGCALWGTCAKEGGESSTHACHFHETHHHAAKMDSRVH